MRASEFLIEEQVNELVKAGYKGIGIMELTKFMMQAPPEKKAKFNELKSAVVNAPNEAVSKKLQNALWKLVNSVIGGPAINTKTLAGESYQPPELNVGDVVMKGKFKNSPAEIKGFKKDKHNQPVLKTNKGDVQLFKPRITKLMTEEFEEDELPLQSINDIKQLLPRIVAAVQQEYDRWDENEDEYAGGGICHLIADEVCSVLSNANIDCSTVSQEIGEQHVYAIAKVREGVYSVDIPPGAYETGGGYTWKKLHDVEFDVRDIELYRITSDTAEFDDMVGY